MFSLQCWRRENGHLHSTEQHPGAGEGRGAPGRVPGCEELEAAEATHGANTGMGLSSPGRGEGVLFGNILGEKNKGVFAG